MPHLQFCSRFLLHSHDDDIVTWISNDALDNRTIGINSKKLRPFTATAVVPLRTASRAYSTWTFRQEADQTGKLNTNLNGNSILTWNKCPSGENTVIARSYRLDIFGQVSPWPEAGPKSSPRCGRSHVCEKSIRGLGRICESCATLRVNT